MTILISILAGVYIVGVLIAFGAVLSIPKNIRFYEAVFAALFWPVILPIFIGFKIGEMVGK